MATRLCFSPGWKSMLFNSRSFSSSLNLCKRKRKRTIQGGHLLKIARRPLLPANFNECLSFSAVSKPHYPFPLILSALRAYSVIPVVTERAIMGVFRVDRKKEIRKTDDIQGTLKLPYPVFGSSQKVGVFADGELAEKAKEAGGTVISSSDLHEYFQKVADGKEQLYSSFLSSMAMQSQMRAFSRQLREKTPTVKKGMVFDDADKLCARIQDMMYTRKYILYKAGFIRFPIGTVCMTDEQILENFRCVYDEVMRVLTPKNRLKVGVHFFQAELDMSFGRQYTVDMDCLLKRT